jgi:hypothetical protein
LGEPVALAFLGGLLAALAGHENLAPLFGFLLAADTLDVGGALRRWLASIPDRQSETAGQTSGQTAWFSF